MFTLNTWETRSERYGQPSAAMNTMWSDHYTEAENQNYLGIIREPIGNSSAIQLEQMSEIFAPSFAFDEMFRARDKYCRNEQWPPIGCVSTDITCYKDRLNINLGKD